MRSDVCRVFLAHGAFCTGWTCEAPAFIATGPGGAGHVVEQNPLDDIRALQDVVIVITDGRVAVKRVPFGMR